MQYKSKKFFSGLSTFFKKKMTMMKQLFSISRALERLHIKVGDLGHKKRHNSKPTASLTLQLLPFFPFFAASNAASYASSASHQLCARKQLNTSDISTAIITSRKLLWEHHIEFLSRDCGEPSKNTIGAR